MSFSFGVGPIVPETHWKFENKGARIVTYLDFCPPLLILLVQSNLIVRNSNQGTIFSSEISFNRNICDLTSAVFKLFRPIFTAESNHWGYSIALALCYGFEFVSLTLRASSISL